MSRISRYQDSVDKFFKTKSCIKSLSEENQNLIRLLNDEYSHINSIILLTTLNSQCKRYNLKLHGYYIASGIDILWLIVKINDVIGYYNKLYGTSQISDLTNELILMVNYTLSQNIDSYYGIDPSRVLKIYQSCMNYLNTNIFNCVKASNFSSSKHIKKTEITTYKFSNDETLDKYRTLYLIPSDVLQQYIDQKYGTVCSLALVLGWLLGMGDEKQVSELEKTGKYLGNILKIAYDFKNIERDILHSTGKICKNTVVNWGVKDCFNKFVENKARFIENLLKLGIYTTTIKEIVDIIEKDIDNCINNTDITLNNDFSSYSSI